MKWLSGYAPIFVFFSAILLLVAHHIWAYTGHYGYDDMEYARLAAAWTQGIFDPSNHFSFRFTVLLLTGISYAIFGINDFASALPALCISATVFWIMFQYLRPHGIIAVATGLGLSFLSTWFVFYSDKLMPDIYVALSVLAAVVVLARVKFREGQGTPKRDGFFFAGALFFGFLSKGTILLTLPVFLIFFLADLLRRKRLSFWGWTALWSVLLGAIYLMGCYILAGSAWARFDALYANSYLSHCSYDQQPVALLYERITAALLKIIAADGMLAAYLFILPMLLSRKVAEVWRMSTPAHFFASAAILLLLSANFMSISLSSYSPMCADPRHYLFLVPVAAIAGGLLMAVQVREMNGMWKWPAIHVVAAALILLLEYGAGTRLYVPLAAAMLLWWAFPRVKYIQPWWIPIVWTALVLMPRKIGYASQVQYRQQRNHYQEIVVHGQPDWYVISDPISTRLGAYYSGFENDQSYALLQYGAFDWDTLDARKKVWYDNQYHQSILGLHPTELPLYARSASLQEALIFEDTLVGVSYIALDASSLVSRDERLWLHSTQRFEGLTPLGWTESTAQRTQVDADKGIASAVRGFSSTFRTPFDSIVAGDGGQIEVCAQVNTLMPKPMQVLLVIAVETDGEAVIWEWAAVDRFTKAYGHWWPAKLEVALDKKSIPSGAELVVYVWNQDEAEMYIDDFEVKVYR